MIYTNYKDKCSYTQSNATVICSLPSFNIEAKSRLSTAQIWEGNALYLHLNIGELIKISSAVEEKLCHSQILERKCLSIDVCQGNVAMGFTIMNDVDSLVIYFNGLLVQPNVSLYSSVNYTKWIDPNNLLYVQNGLHLLDMSSLKKMDIDFDEYNPDLKFKAYKNLIATLDVKSVRIYALNKSMNIIFNRQIAALDLQWSGSIEYMIYIIAFDHIEVIKGCKTDNWMTIESISSTILPNEIYFAECYPYIYTTSYDSNRSITFHQHLLENTKPILYIIEDAIYTFKGEAAKLKEPKSLIKSNSKADCPISKSIHCKPIIICSDIKRNLTIKVKSQIVLKENDKMDQLRYSCSNLGDVHHYCCVCLMPILMKTQSKQKCSMSMCTLCCHTAHRKHHEEWFKINKECPIPYCHCYCNSKEIEWADEDKLD